MEVRLLLAQQQRRLASSRGAFSARQVPEAQECIAACCSKGMRCSAGSRSCIVMLHAYTAQSQCKVSFM